MSLFAPLHTALAPFSEPFSVVRAKFFCQFLWLMREQETPQSWNDLLSRYRALVTLNSQACGTGGRLRHIWSIALTAPV